MEIEYIDLWYTDVASIASDEDIKLNLVELPMPIQKYVLKHKRFVQRRSRLVGYILLHNYLKKTNKSNNWEERLLYNKYGKPSITDFFDFSIAHSAQKVILTVNTKGSIGVDIQRIRSFKDLSIFEDFLHIKEWEYIGQLNTKLEQTKALIEFWVKREALFKLLGIGLTTSSNHIDCTKDIIIWKSKKYSFVKIDIEEEYIGYLCFLGTKNKRVINFLNYSF